METCPNISTGDLSRLRDGSWRQEDADLHPESPIHMARQEAFKVRSLLRRHAASVPQYVQQYRHLLCIREQNLRRCIDLLSTYPTYAKEFRHAEALQEDMRGKFLLFSLRENPLIVRIMNDFYQEEAAIFNEVTRLLNTER